MVIEASAVRSQLPSYAFRIGAVVLAFAALMLLPFLPGKYDGLAQMLSVSVQLVGIVGLLLVPVGILWFTYEVRKLRRVERNLPHIDKRYRFATAALVVASVVTCFIALAAFAGERLSFGILELVFWLYVLHLGITAIRGIKEAESPHFSATPLYLIIVPPSVLLLQLVLAAPAAEFSRNRAIAASALMIEEIEAYQRAHGHYPESMLGINKDYHPSVLGIDRYHYARRGAAYNLVFEQPLFLLDELGAREFVVYNPLDEHVILSHAVWNVIWTPEESATRQGWFATHQTEIPHWRYFWFD